MGSRLICICNVVTEKEIVSALKKGAMTTKDIQIYTNAGTSCGRCLSNIESIVNDYHSTVSDNLQGKLDFKI